MTVFNFFLQEILLVGLSMLFGMSLVTKRKTKRRRREVHTTMIKTNLNQLAQRVVFKEGLKKSVSIAQCKEIMKVIFTTMAKMDFEEVATILKRYQ